MKYLKFIKDYIQEYGINKTIQNILYLFKSYGFVGFFFYFLHKQDRSSYSPSALTQFINELHKNETDAGMIKIQSSPYSSESSNIKCFAFYLPQFHEIPVNNETWGNGFTEWTNVARGTPQFLGHHQPKIPRDLGFYDLAENSNIINRQISMAKNAGVAGFCFHYYWFNGERLLFKPIERFLKDCPPDFHFILNWANENWTKRWDGKDNEIIIANDLENINIESFFNDLLPILKHPQYQMFAENTPWLMIYRPELIPSVSNFALKLKSLAKQSGFSDLHISFCQSFDQRDAKSYGMDSAVEFPPHGVFDLIKPNTKSVQIVNPDFKGQIYNMEKYSEIYEQYCRQQHDNVPVFRTVFPSWDNEARKPNKGNIFFNMSTREFLNWTQVACNFTSSDNFGDKVLFVNAWNEWAEGAYLEPDTKFGFAYLETLKKIILSGDKEIQKKLEHSQQKSRIKSPIAIVMYIFYPELIQEFLQYLKNIKSNFDLYISFPNTLSVSEKHKIIEAFPEATFSEMENRGRDILPFLKTIRQFDLSKYKYVCKLHTKKSPHRSDGDLWRSEAIYSIIGSEDLLKKSLKLMDEGYGLVSAKNMNLSIKDFPGSNTNQIKKFCEILNIKLNDDYHFIAGSMFWIHQDLIVFLSNSNIKDEHFEHERGQVDGTFAHGFERALGNLCAEQKLKVGGMDIASNRFEVHSPQNYIPGFRNEAEL